MVSCPKCGKLIMDGSHFCMYCGQNITGVPSNMPNANIPQQPDEPKKSNTGKVIGIIFSLLLALAAIGGYLYYSYVQKQEQLRIEEELRQEAIEDSLEQVLFEEQAKAEAAKKAESDRLEDVSVFVKSLYSYRGEYRNKIIRFYTSDLLSAYKKWHTDDEELDGPQALFYEKKWDEGCGTWVIIRNFKSEIVEGSSPDEFTATVEVNVSFAVYSAYENEEFMQNDSHNDVLYLKYEGEWKIDDLVRDGKSVKDAYLKSSSNYGRIVC